MLFTGKNKTRMLQWLLLAVVVYSLASVLSMMHQYGDAGALPRVQVVLWKVGHLMVAAWLGYGADRSIFRDRIGSWSPDLIHLRRAIIVAAFVLAMALAV